MWQQQQQQAYLRGSSSQYPQQQAVVHPVPMINPDNRAHQQHHQHHHQHYQHHQQHRAAVMDLPVPSNPRASRNLAEKQRRDNLNMHIASMAALVPIVATSTKRMDKISVLRLACSFLRTHYTIGRGLENFLPEQFNEFDLEQYIVGHLVENGFFLIVTRMGKIVYVSQQVEQYLGYPQNELLGQYLYNFIDPNDIEKLSKDLAPTGMKEELPEYLTPKNNSQTSESKDNNSSSSDDSTSTQQTNKKIFFSKERRTFQIYLAQRTAKREDRQYECFEISGVFRLANACENADLNGNNGRYLEGSKLTTNDIIFVGIAMQSKKRSLAQLSVMDATKNEYMTRHLVDGRIIYCDHRVAFVAGYMSEEVSGLNAFAFMHKDDFRWTMLGLRQMYDQPAHEPVGTSCYRLLTKTGQFIYLRTRGYLERDKVTNTVESFFCINTLVSEEEGIRLIKEMKEKLSATMSTNGLISNLADNNSIEMCSSSQSPNPKSDLEEPKELEVAINHLVSELPTSSTLISTSTSSISEDSLSPNTHANKVGINNCTPLNPSKAEESPISDSESAKPPGKSIMMLDMMENAHNGCDNGQNADLTTQSNIRVTKLNSYMSCNRTLCMGFSQRANVLNTQESMKQQSNASMLSPNMSQEDAPYIKVECDVGTFNSRKKQVQKSAVSQYFGDTPSNSSIVSASAKTHSKQSMLKKRICSDEDFSATHKKRSSSAYALTNTNEEQRDISHMKGKTFVGKNEYSTLEFNQYNDVNLQPLMTAESLSSNLLDYQKLMKFVNPLIVTNGDEEPFMQVLKDDTLLSSDLDSNPEFTTEILDSYNVPNESTTDFKNDFNESRQQFEDQIINKLRHTHSYLSKEQMVRESQINMLAQKVKHPALHIQREKLSQIQFEENEYKYTFENVTKDLNKMHTCMSSSALKSRKTGK